MRITKELAIALTGKEDEYESLQEHYKNMIQAFLEINTDRTTIVNHCVSRYLATKFLNSTGLHEFTQDIVAEMVKGYVDAIASRNDYYFLPFKEIARLTYGYATMFNNITYYEYVISPNEEASKPIVNTKDYFYTIFNGINFISEADYAILSSNVNIVNKLNYKIALGMKFINRGKNKVLGKV